MKKSMLVIVTMLCWCGTSYGVSVDPTGPTNPCNGLICQVGYMLNTKTCKCYCARVCDSGYTLNTDTCECECTLECADGYNLDADACTCEKRKCSNGGYHDGTACVPCPGNEDNFSNSDCWYADNDLGFRACMGTSSINCGLHSANDGANGISDCYWRAKTIGGTVIVGPGGTIDKSKCEYTDDVGTYELSSDCYYDNTND